MKRLSPIRTPAKRAARLVPLAAIGALLAVAAAILLWPKEPVPDLNTGGPSVSGDVNWIIPANEIEGFKARAQGGDSRAAESLANHYAELHQPVEQRRWLTLAAQQGNCNAIDLLRDQADRAGDARSALQWTGQLRRHGCADFLPNATSANAVSE